MKKWKIDIEIDAPIEQVWKFFDGSLEDMKKIVPILVEHRPIKITEEGVGSVYRRTNRYKGQLQEHDIETLEYVNETNKKKLKVNSIMENILDITNCYELNKIDHNKTLLKYKVIYVPLNWQMNLSLLFTKKKPLIEFVERIKNTAEFEAETEVIR
ncbi:SRPBCC family protein [Metabacillus fastidiosus]|uniref:SRPBCC family protein n=1 Tax=Metabacillus fastidiosus TaxID=1458 RepID=UPI002E21F5A0|nr:SRPBCC family protein [Metabacillus fastidiosus]